MKTKLLLTAFLFFILIKSGISQNELTSQAPSLQIGLSSFDFTKGAIDPVILGQIISEKQEQVKVKLIKSMLLEKIGYNNALFYNYINNTIDVITKQKDINTLTKNLLENTVNLVFVVSFTEFYIDSNNCTNHPKLDEFLNKIKKSDISFNKIYIKHNLFGKGSDPIKQDEKSNNNEIDKSKSILLDMASDVIQNNKKLAALGLLRTSYFQNSCINNSYLEAIQNDLEITLENKEVIKVTREELKAIHDEMSKNIDLYISNLNIIKRFVADSKNNASVKFQELLNSINEAYPKYINKDISQIERELLVAISSNKKDLADKEISILINFFEKIKFIKYRPDDIIFDYENNVKPFLSKLDKYDTSFVTIRRNLNNYIYSSISSNDSLKNILNSICIDEYSPFIQLLFTLNDFNKVETYNKYLDYIGNAGDVFSNSQMRKSINQIISFVRGFIKPSEINSNSDIKKYTIDIDVQGFVSSLIDLPFNKNRPLQIFFTVGVNNLAFINNQYQLDSITKVGNLSYMSEKIGLKFKIYNPAYTKSFNRGDIFHARGRTFLRLQPPKEPTISNVHLLVYGSGLLYNLVNVKTNKNFNASLWGLGVGLTFFNDLDLNISAGKTFETYKNVPWFINIGFDVRITEYLSKLNKQRDDKKTLKKLNNAYELSKDYREINN